MGAITSSNFHKSGSTNENHYYLLDLLRWFCAINVVMWHFQFFFVKNTLQGDKINGTAPYAGTLKFFYSGTLGAVTIFWIISGFVISSRYSSTKESIYVFLRNRFARLYPLHFITLILVAIIQSISKFKLGHFLVISSNTIREFICNIFMINGWGPSNSISFNAPFWSVSIEIIVYIVFSIFLHRIYSYGIVIPTFFFLIFLTLDYLRIHHNFGLWECGKCFFAGVLINYFRKLNLIRSVVVLSAPSMIMMGLGLIDTRFILQLFIVLLIIYLDDKKIALRMKFLKFLGDATYSIYLLHFPFTIFILLVIESYQLPQQRIVTNPIFLICYLLLLNLISVATYRIFENPLRIKLKNKI
jgi:peptidoglycan/LPS O-acetylase OafA/YrhL